MDNNTKTLALDLLLGLLDEIDRCGVTVSPELETAVRAYVAANR